MQRLIAIKTQTCNSRHLNIFMFLSTQSLSRSFSGSEFCIFVNPNKDGLGSKTINIVLMMCDMTDKGRLKGNFRSIRIKYDSCELELLDYRCTMLLCVERS